MVDVDGLPKSPIELRRTLTNGSGRQPCGLQNRLRGVRRRLPKFTFVHQSPHRKQMTANDSQDARPPRLPVFERVVTQN